eukprot:jgi/Orpsp1_1/1176836/evm.model.c7180000059206.1
MKLQIVVTASVIAALASPIAINALTPEEYYEKYGVMVEYCDSCDFLEEGQQGDDQSGLWHTAEDQWCIPDEKCFQRECEPVDGYPCCEDPSAEIFDIDRSGTWGVENDGWCLIKSLQPFTEVHIYSNAHLERGPYYGRPRWGANFIFKIADMSLDEFFEKYEIETILINGHNISVDDIYVDIFYENYPDAFGICTKYYIENKINEEKFVIKNKETGISYTLEESNILVVTY